MKHSKFKVGDSVVVLLTKRSNAGKSHLKGKVFEIDKNDYDAGYRYKLKGCGSVWLFSDEELEFSYIHNSPLMKALE